MDDRDIGQPDPLRIKIFSGQGLSPDERMAALIEFVAQLDDRLKELETLVTELVVRDVKLD